VAQPTKEPLTAPGPGVAPRLLGGYHVLDEIGRNAVGPLYLARLEGPNGFQRWAAIRRVDPRHLAEQGYVQRFHERVRAGAKLLHPNVTALFDVGADDAGPWVAMEYLHGERVEETIERLEIADTPASWEIAARIIADAAEGLHAVHSLRDKEGAALGLLHGDLAPHSVAVTYEGKTKIKGAFEPRAHGVLDPRKVAYAAPEQLFDGVVDSRADVFALGVLLWELLAGKRLFARASDHETRAMIEAGVVPSLADLVAELPKELDALVRRALARDPTQRFASARELSRELESLLVSKGLVARDDDVGRYLRTLFADRYEEQEARLHAAADVTEVFRKSQQLRAVKPLPDLSPKDAEMEETELMRRPLESDDDPTTAEVGAVVPRAVSGFTDEIPADSGPTMPRANKPPIAAASARGSLGDTDEVPTITAPQPKLVLPPTPPPVRRFSDEEQTVTAAIVKNESSTSRLIMPSSLESEPDVTESAIFVAPRIPAPTPPDIDASPPPMPPPRPQLPSFPDRPLLPATPETGVTAVARPPFRSHPLSTPPPGYVPTPAFEPPPAFGTPSAGPHRAMSTASLRAVLFPRDRARRTLVVSIAGFGGGALLFLLFLVAWRYSAETTAPTAATVTPQVHVAAPPPAETTAQAVAATSAAVAPTTPAPTATAAPKAPAPTATSLPVIPTIDLSKPAPKHVVVRHRTWPTTHPRHESTAPSGKMGYLTVMCHPDACDHIVDEGRDLGGSPLFRKAVSSGKHVLTLRVDSTHAQKLVTVDVPEGQTGVAIRPDVSP
jgi:serine/threonine protein kinase